MTRDPDYMEYTVSPDVMDAVLTLHQGPVMTRQPARRRVARKMLDHVGTPSDSPEPWPARGPPADAGESRWLDHEPRAHEPASDVE